MAANNNPAWHRFPGHEQSDCPFNRSYFCTSRPGITTAQTSIRSPATTILEMVHCGGRSVGWQRGSISRNTTLGTNYRHCFADFSSLIDRTGPAGKPTVMVAVQLLANQSENVSSRRRKVFHFQPSPPATIFHQHLAPCCSKSTRPILASVVLESLISSDLQQTLIMRGVRISECFE